MAAPDQPPRSVVLATALAYAEAGVLLIAGLLLFLSGPSFARAAGINVGLIVLIAVVPIVLAAVFFRGARQVRAGSGRTLLLWLSAVMSVLQVVSLVNVAANNAQFSTILMAALYLAIPVVITVQLLQPATVAWVEAHRGQPAR
jgi:hypothetical protein